MWYYFHALMEDRETLENGIVLVVISKDHPAPGPALWKAVPKIINLLTNTMPITICAIHDCAPPAPWFAQIFLPVLKWFLGQRLRSRYVLHSGTDESILSELDDPFGIPKDYLPQEIGGDLDFSAARKEWIQGREEAGK